MAKPNPFAAKGAPAPKAPLFAAKGAPVAKPNPFAAKGKPAPKKAPRGC